MKSKGISKKVHVQGGILAIFVASHRDEDK